MDATRQKNNYKGVVESFDSVKMMHKIVCDDGDVEILKLAEVKSKLIEEHSMPNQEPPSEGETPDEASKLPKGKKAKTSDESLTARGGGRWQAEGGIFKERCQIRSRQRPMIQRFENQKQVI